jgi:predicted  nucleic acid-binding Zn-ribbon protein
MGEQQLGVFIKLVSFDQQTRSFENEYESLRNMLGNLNDKVESLTRQVECAKRELQDVRRDVNRKEELMRVLDQQETEKKRRIELIVNPKEYFALKNEIVRINEEQRNNEHDLIDAWEKFELAKKKISTEEEFLKKSVSEIEQSRIEIKDKLKALSRCIDEQNGQRTRYTQLVSKDLLENYERMRLLVHNPVVPVIQSSCSACFYAIPVQDLVVIKQGQLLPCKGCYRILYDEE